MSVVRKTLTLREAQKLSLPRTFTTLVKPVGSRCNMRCSYCYYLDKALLYDMSPKTVMSDAVLRTYIKDFIAANDVDTVNFCWHGGEPLMAGMEFYERALFYQEKYRGDKRIENTLQTNGLLLNEKWAKFFRAHNFLLGVSLDGPEDIHDAYRKDAGSRPTFSRVMRGIEFLKAEGTDFNTLSVVNDKCAGRGKEVYNFFKSIGSNFMQFLPAVEFISHEELRQFGGRGRILSPEDSEAGALSPWSTEPLAFGQYMCDIFDEWRVRDIGEYYVQLFDVTLANWHGEQPGLCAYAKSCGDGLAVEHNGDVYSCDHFVYPEYKLGNIMTSKMGEMYRSTRQFDFGVSKRNGLPDNCLNCDFYHLCNGGCPKHRFRSTADELQKNYLCEGYKLFFEHTAPYMKRMSELIHLKQAPSLIMTEDIKA
ncbi:MAG: anaerobic sulfatase maturase [Rikenellaceae bacterium]